jgi:hypothetical protein
MTPLPKPTIQFSHHEFHRARAIIVPEGCSAGLYQAVREWLEERDLDLDRVVLY